MSPRRKAASKPKSAEDPVDYSQYPEVEPEYMDPDVAAEYDRNYDIDPDNPPPPEFDIPAVDPETGNVYQGTPSEE